jgi:hypothetical protein
MATFTSWLVSPTRRGIRLSRLMASGLVSQGRELSSIAGADLVEADCAAPVTASILRTPAAIAFLDKGEGPMSPVRAQCVPPQSSRLKPGTDTTRTLSPYFSPNRAVAPAAIASPVALTSVSTVEFFRT